MSEMSWVTSTMTTATIEQASSRSMSLFAAALDQQPAEAAVVEQRLDDDDAGQQPRELQHDHGEGRDQRVAERVLQHDAAEADALQPRGADVLLGHHLGHRGAGHPGDVAHAVDGDGQHRQGEVVEGRRRRRPPRWPSRRTIAGRPSGWRRSPSAPRPRRTPASRWCRWRRSRAPGPAPSPRACRRGRRAAAPPGTITTITQNISFAVSQSRGQSTSATGALNRVECPKSPRTTPPSHSP